MVTQGWDFSSKYLQMSRARSSVSAATCRRYKVPEPVFLGDTVGASPDSSFGYSLSKCAQRRLAASALDLNAPSCMPYDPACSEAFALFSGAGGGIGAAAGAWAAEAAALELAGAGLPTAFAVSAPAGVVFEGAWAREKFSTRIRASSVHFPSG